MKPWVPVAALALAFSPLVVVRPVVVEGRSMEPALRTGELRWGLRAWASHPPRRGEVWLVEGPEGAVVKRILALPGERLEMKDHEPWIDGRCLEEPWVEHPERSGSPGGEGAWSLDGAYFLMGDNRPQSRDCRSWGPLPAAALRARLL